MERTLYNQKGEATAYLSDDFHATIYLWEGLPVAYIYEDRHLYGINGQHLGWFIDEILYNNDGERIGFTSNSSPVAVAKEPIKPKKYPRDEIRPRWKAPPLPKLDFKLAEMDLADFLREGQVPRYGKDETPKESTDS